MRESPSVPESEEQVIACVLVDHQLLPRVATTLLLADFYDARCRLAWEAITKLDAQGQRPDRFLVAKEMKATLPNKSADWLAGIMSRVATTQTLDWHMAQVRKAAARRQIIDLAGVMLADAYEGELDPLLERAQSGIYALAAQRTEGFRGLGTYGTSVMAAIEETARTGKRRGLSTGYPDWDDAMGGLCPGHLIVIAARPGVGKSAIMLSTSENLARAGVPSAIFSMEMSGEDLAERSLSHEAQIDSQALRCPLAPEALARLRTATARIATLPIWVDDSGTQTLRTLRTKARHWHTEVGQVPGVLWVDYVQLMSGERKGKDYSREREVAEVIQGLKALAKEMKLPVVALGQLNRKPAARGGPGAKGKPRLEDLRESGAIEQAADKVVLLWRDKAAPGTADLLLPKNRGGRADVSVRLRYIAEHTRFENLTRAAEQGSLL